MIVIVRPPIRRTEPPTIEVPILKEGCRPVVLISNRRMIGQFQSFIFRGAADWTNLNMEINSAIEVLLRNVCGCFSDLMFSGSVRSCGIAGSCAVGRPLNNRERGGFDGSP